uniref:NB-ARC domain containing protein n=1 Tax=Solanum tuberosum TaxID=4113 RepID=M1A3W2_SOLTU
MVIAGGLRGSSTTNDWLRVERTMAHLFINYNVGCGVFVDMSYGRLPQEVQMCFLYCGIFPRGFDIPAWKLIRMWIAEGLIKPQQSYTLEEIAEHHLNVLVDRNLVILLQKRSDGQIKTCRLHGMLHEFCRRKAANKWLFQEICTSADNSLPSIQDSDTCRRLCIQPSTLCDSLHKTFCRTCQVFLLFFLKTKTN